MGTHWSVKQSKVSVSLTLVLMDHSGSCVLKRLKRERAEKGDSIGDFHINPNKKGRCLGKDW